MRSAPLTGGPCLLWPHLVLGRPGPCVLAPLGLPHRLRCVTSRLFLATGHDLPACADHAYQAAGLALLVESSATTGAGTPPAAVRLVPGALPRGGSLQVFLPLMWPQLPAMPPDPSRHDLLHGCPKLLWIAGYDAQNLSFKYLQDQARAGPDRPSQSVWAQRAGGARDVGLVFLSLMKKGLRSTPRFPRPRHSEAGATLTQNSLPTPTASPQG